MAGIAGILRGRAGLSVHEIPGVDELCAPGLPAPTLVLYDVAAMDAAQVLACLAAAPAIVGLDLRRDRAVTLMGEFYPLATVDDLAALFATLRIEAAPALPAQPGPRIQMIFLSEGAKS